MSAIRALILDFDGVLVESNEAKTLAFEDLFALYPAYRDAMIDYHLANYSRSRMMKFEHYVYELMGRPGDVEMIQAMAHQFSGFVVRRVMACPRVPGARAFLDEFSQEVPLYVSSVTPQDELRQIIRARGIDSFFVEVFGDPPCRKPDAIRAVLTREKVLPSEVIFVGDSASDYRAAVETGVEFVGRNSGLPFDGIEVKLHRDLYEIADVVRQRLKGRAIVSNDLDILVTLSTFSAYSEEPLRLLEQSKFTFSTNPYGRRMEPDEVVELGWSCSGLVAGVEQYTAETLAQLPNLRCISRCGAGIDNIDLAEARRRGIAVLNTPDEPIVAVAELTLAMMLALLRQLPKVDSLTRERKWQRVTGNLLAGKIVGIIGLGRIGRRVATLVQAFGVTVIGVEPYPDSDWMHGHGVELLDLPTLLARADIVSIHASTSSEHPLRLGAAELAQMRQGAWLINMARGDMVDDVALSEALASGWLSGAGLDVFPMEPYRGPLCDNDRVILSPHQATLTVETRTAMEVRAVENVVRYLRGEK